MMRFSGLATGLDTDTMVRDLMRAQRMKVDKLFQDRTLLEWKQTDYRSMNNLLSTLRNKSFDMRLQSAYNKFNVTSFDEGVVSATATGNASATSYTFNSVTALASAATLVSAPSEGPISENKSVIKGNPFSVPTFTYPVGEDAMPEHANRFQVKLNGGEWVNIDLPADKTYNSNKDLVIDLQATLDAAGLGTIKAHVTTGNRLMMVSDNPTDAFSLQAVEGSSMLARLGINTTTSSNISSKVEKLDQTLSFTDLFAQGRLTSLSTDLNWISNVSDSLTVTVPSVDYKYTMDIDYAELKTDENPQNISIKLNGRAFTIFTGEGDVPLGKVRLTEEAGKVALTFASDEVITEGSVVEVSRQDFEATLSNYNQNGERVTETYLLNAQTESLSSLISRINNSRVLGLSAYYDEVSDKMSLTSKWKGNNNTSGNDIELSDFFASVLKLDPTKGGYVDGKDAEFVLNGLSTSRKDNVFSINGVSFTLKQTTAQAVTLSVAQDSESIFNSIQEYVKLYNDTIDGINKKLSEERFAGFPPLTDEQKSAMKDTDIEKWEEKSRSGMLKGDTLLQSTLDEMRRLLADPVSGVASDTMKQLSSIGITTGGYYERGKLNINQDKLKAAIETDPQAVMELFTKTGTTTSDQGIAARLHSALTGRIKQLSDRAGTASSISRVDTSTIGEQIKRINQRISSENLRLTRVEDRYWRQFTALEKSINTMNSQSAWLASQFQSN